MCVGLDPPAEKRDIPARIMWRSPAQAKGRAFYGAKLETRMTVRRLVVGHQLSVSGAQIKRISGS
jgi:hypothetical protein